MEVISLKRCLDGLVKEETLVILVSSFVVAPPNEYTTIPRRSGRLMAANSNDILYIVEPISSKIIIPIIPVPTLSSPPLAFPPRLNTGKCPPVRPPLYSWFQVVYWIHLMGTLQDSSSKKNANNTKC